MTDLAEDKRNGNLRWLILLLMSLVIFANYYLYDCFSTLKGTIQTELGVSSTDYGLIRSFYQVPNTFLFMALLGGIFLDRFGIRITGVAFTLLCALGGGVTAYGVSPAFRDGGPLYDFMGSFLTDYSPEVKMMMLGRLLFGLGAETQIVMLTKVLAKWFSGKELALAFGINLGIARIGSALAMSLSPQVATDHGWNTALWLGAVVMLSGLVLFLIYVFIDRKQEKSGGMGAKDAGKMDPDEVFRIKDIFALLKNRSYLFIALLCTAFYAVVFPFQDYLADLLTHEHGYSSVEAGSMTSKIPYAAVVFTILFGAFVDWKGKRASLMIGGSFLLVLALSGFAFTEISPWVLVPLFGIAFSLVPAAMWPSVTLLVPASRLGTAFGLMTWMQNLGWWGMSILAGKVLDKTNPEITPEVLRAGTGQYNYLWTLVLFLGLAAVAVLLALGLKAVDRGPKGYGLELPSRETIQKEEA